MSLRAWKKWLNGLIGGFVNATTEAVTLMSVDSDHWRKFLLPTALQGLLGAWLYLKQHPTPWDGVERRAPWDGKTERRRVK